MNMNIKPPTVIEMPASGHNQPTGMPLELFPKLKRRGTIAFPFNFEFMATNY